MSVARLGVRSRHETGNGDITVGEALRAEPASREPWAAQITEVSDYIERNRAAWDRWAPGLAAQGRKDWSERELSWGLWRTPESQLGLVEGLVPGADIIELGCGTASTSALLARAGLRPVAVDFSRHQLENAHLLQQEMGPSFPLVHANLEQVPYDLESFDVAVSEYGASLWCDPRRWLPEAHRLLRPNGRLVFIANSAFLMACTPPEGGAAGEHLIRDAFGDNRVEFADHDTVEFHLTHGRWLRILGAAGFVIEDLIEVQPTEKATPRYEFASVEWALRWPSEEIWVARKTR